MLHRLTRRLRGLWLGVLSLALALTASGSVWCLLDGVFFRAPPHVEAADGLRRLYFLESFPGLGLSRTGFTSYPNFEDLRTGVRSFSALGAFASASVPFGRGEEARNVDAVFVSPGYFSTLGVQPRLGHLPTEAGRTQEGGSDGVVLSEELWRRSFGFAPGILGKEVWVGGSAFPVVAVVPAGFTGVGLEAVDLWLPLSAGGPWFGGGWKTSRGSSFLEVIGRIRQGASGRAVAQEATGVFRRTANVDPGDATAGVELGPILLARGPERDRAASVLLWLAALAWLLLVLAWIGVANLLLARGLKARPETRLRLALGAGRWRIALDVALDGLLLAGLAGVAALLAAPWLMALLQRTLFLGTPSLQPLEQFLAVDFRRIAMFAGASLLSALAAAGFPALWASRGDLGSDLRAGGAGRFQGPGTVRGVLAASQVALALVLLVGAGLFLKSWARISRLDLGVDVDRLLVVTGEAEEAGKPGDPEPGAALRRALERVRTLPGVEKAALAATVPFATSAALSISIPGREALPELASGGPYANAVSEDFFATTGTKILVGRGFTPADGQRAAPVVVVNQTLARLAWPGQRALGACLRWGGSETPCAEVVGIAADARRSSLVEGETMQIYLPLEQAPQRLFPQALLVRMAPWAGGSLGPSVRKAVRPEFPAGTFVEVQSLATRIEPQTRAWRLGSSTFLLFSLIALGLAVGGLHAEIARALAERRRELGLRLALGASLRAVQGLALRRVAGLALPGIVVGLGCVFLGRRWIGPLLFQTSPADPTVLALAAGVVLATTLLAGWIPILLLRRIDPAEILRRS